MLNSRNGPTVKLGQYVGYLPQDVALLDATVEENISRLEPKTDRSCDRGGGKDHPEFTK